MQTKPNTPLTTRALSEQWGEIPILWRDRAYKRLIDLPVGGMLDLSTIPAPHDQTFAVIAKYCITYGEFIHLGWNIEFNNDFSKIRKIC